MPVAHISCFEFNLKSLKRLDYEYDVNLSLKIILCHILEKEIKLRTLVDQLKDLLLKKSEMNFTGIFSTIDVYGEGLLDPDK